MPSVDGSSVGGSSVDGSSVDGARWVCRVASTIRRDATSATKYAVREHEVWTRPPMDARGLPVLLVGGLAGSGAQLQVLSDWLVRLNCRPVIAPTRSGVDCGERTTGWVTEALEKLNETSGRRSVMIAHSRGGQFARAVAVRHPELLHGVVTLGSPVTRHLGIHPRLKAELVALGVAGSLGVPGIFRPSCVWGSCCRRLRSDLLTPFPADVSWLSVYSRLDRVVDWRTCLDPAARHREVATSHGGLLFAPAVFEALAQELRTLLDPSWDPVAVAC